MAGGGVGGGGVVVDAQFGQRGQKLDEVEQAVAVAAADVGLGDVVAAGSYALLYALNVRLGAGQSDVEDVDFDAARGGLSEQPGHGGPAQGGFEDEVEVVFDCVLEESF